LKITSQPLSHRNAADRRGFWNSVENVAGSGFGWEGWEAKFASVGCLEDVSVRDLGWDTIGGWLEVGDLASYLGGSCRWYGYQ
jgi:hypothetical protein